MDINNFKCLICLEVFNNAYVPCTLYCGHSLCIDHIKEIQKCPLCNQSIKNSSEIKPNCILRDISKEFIKINKHIYIEEYNEIIENEIKNLEKNEKNARYNIHKNRFDEINNMNNIFKMIINEIYKKTKEIKKLNKLIQNIDFFDSNIETTRYFVDSILDLDLGSEFNSESELNSECEFNSEHEYNSESEYDEFNLCLCGNLHCQIIKNQKKCCSCLDKRKKNTIYYQYVDGKGNIKGGNRYDNYCPSCVDFYKKSDSKNKKN